MASFATGIKSFQNMTEKKLDRTIRKTALDLYKGILESTPVDTSRLRQNNLISIDKEDTRELEENGTTINQQMSEAESKLSKKVAGSIIYIQNNLDYAIKNEYGLHEPKNSKKVKNGFSTQAPSGFYGINVLRFSNILKTNYKRNAMGTGYYFSKEIS